MISHGLHIVLWAAALIALLASAYTDLKDRIIPNELVGIVAASGVILSLVLRPEQAWISLLAATLLLVALGVIAHYGMLGGGDIKLISATALLVPPGHIGKLLLFIALAGGVLSCAYLAARYALRSRATKLSGPPPGAVSRQQSPARAWFVHESARIVTGGPMPYGIAIFGGVAALIAGELSQCLYAGFCSL
jgi:prepilin peptidase CpaA